MVDKLPPMNLPGPSVPYMRAIEKMLLDLENRAVRAEQNLTNIRSSASANGTSLDLANTRLNNLDRTVNLVPLAPTNVIASQVWDWDDLKNATSTMLIAWDTVTKSGSGDDVNVVTYEVWLRAEGQDKPQRAIAVGDKAAIITRLKPNTNFYASVNAVTASGVAGGLSNEIFVAAPSPLAPLDPPTAPELTTGYGVVAVHWDGRLSNADPLPYHFDFVRLYVAASATGPWTPAGPVFRDAGSTVVGPFDVDSHQYFKFVAYDRMGGHSPDSTVSDIVVAGVDLGTLDADLTQLRADLNANQSALDAAQDDIDLALNGPLSGTRLIAGSVVAGALLAGTITSNEIGAGTITANNIGAGQITAENIGAGQIQAKHLAADSVEANKIKAGVIQASHLSPSVGGSIDISANNSVNILAGNIDAANSAINGVGGTVDAMSTYYQFGANGATITSPDSVFAVGIRSDRIDMLERGVAVSSWNAGQLLVNSFVGNEVILGNHKLEKYGTGTVVRAI